MSKLCWNRCASIGQDRNYNITVHVQGGGVSGQRDAIQLGIARALVKLDPDLKPQLKMANSSPVTRASKSARNRV